MYYYTIYVICMFVSCNQWSVTCAYYMYYPYHVITDTDYAWSNDQFMCPWYDVRDNKSK